MDAAQAAAFDAFLAAKNFVSLTRYLSAGSLAFALWEHAITFDREYELIWKLGHPTSKCMFLLNRYGLLLGLTYALSVILVLPRSHLNDKLCGSFAVITLICTVIDTIGSNVYLTTRLHLLWGRQKHIFYVLITALVGTHVPALILTMISLKTLSNNMTYNGMIGECILGAKPTLLIAAWALVVAFDLILIALISMNALDRPRHRDVELLVYLKSDSAAFFAGLLCMRFATLVLLITLPASKVFVYIFFITWPLTSAALSRFILGSEAFKYSLGTRADYLTYEMETRRWHASVIDK